MPATPSQLRRPILVDRTVDFGDGVTVTFRIDRNKITDAWFRQWQNLEADMNVAAVNDMLADLIHSWDVVNDDGTPYPVSSANISDLFSVPDKGRLVEAFMEAVGAGERRGKRLSEYLVYSRHGLHERAGDPPEWAGAFAVATALGRPVDEVEHVPLYWVRAAQLWLEAQNSAELAAQSRRN